MGKSDLEPAKIELRKAFGIVGDQDIKTEMKPKQKAFLVELARLKNVPIKPETKTEILEDVLKNVLENEALNEQEKE